MKKLTILFICLVLLGCASPVFAQECPEIITCTSYTWYTNSKRDKYEYMCKWENTSWKNEKEIKIRHKKIYFYNFESALELGMSFFKILNYCPEYYFVGEQNGAFYEYIAVRKDIEEVEKVAECLQDKKECYRVYLQDKIKNDWR